MNIFTESQKDRDNELSALTGISIEDVMKCKIASPDSIRIFGEIEKPSTEKGYLDLYSKYPHLNLTAFLRTLMCTSASRRSRYFKGLDITNKVCLDFGSGVGTHAIYLLSKGNKVDILDVDGPLLDFAYKRIISRGYVCNKFFHDKSLTPDYYDIVVCLDVLEHVFDPTMEIARIFDCLKKNGLLLLEVSSMVKESSGHFKGSIQNWKAAGEIYLNKHFIRQGKGIYKKRE